VLRQTLLAVALSLGLAGCVTVANTASPEQIASFRLDSVSVAFAPGADIWWGDGERDFAVSRGLSPLASESIASTPEAQAYVRSAIAAKVRDAFTKRLAGSLKGTQPVRIDVLVREVRIASAAQRILVGGDHVFKADVDVVDPRTGRVYLAFPAQRAAATGGNGLLGVALDNILRDEPINLAISAYASQYTDWLLRK
jgi:hypothetical protein